MLIIMIKIKALFTDFKGKRTILLASENKQRLQIVVNITANPFED